MEFNMNDLWGYFLIGLIIIGAITILYLPIFFILKKRVSAIRQLCFLLFAGCAFIVLFATILLGLYDCITFRPAQQTMNIIPFDWVREPWDMGISKMITQLISNIIMFVPIGFFIPIVFAKARSFLKTALWVFVFTFIIEAFQYFTGRSSDIDDIILNLLGGILGYAIFAVLSHCFQRKNWWLRALGSGK
jgi:glycopeptide antibiotics resistance protein